jgi:hypothetical protein
MIYKNNAQRVRSFWIIKISQKCSLGWRELLKLGELTTQFIRSVEDGNKYFLMARLVAS